MPDPDLEIRGGGAVIQTIRNGGIGLPKNIFRPLGPQFGLTIMGGQGPPGRSSGSATAIYIGQPEFRIKNQIVRAILIGKFQKDYANYKKKITKKINPYLHEKSLSLVKKN